MNRRGFLSLLTQATVGAAVVYSFPSVIVPKNIEPRRPNPSFSFGSLNGGLLAVPGPSADGLLVPYIWMNTGMRIDYGNLAKGMSDRDALDLATLMKRSRYYKVG